MITVSDETIYKVIKISKLVELLQNFDENSYVVLVNDVLYVHPTQAVDTRSEGWISFIHESTNKS